MSALTAPTPSLILSATDAIYRAWLPIIGEAQAREQAEAFARRFDFRTDETLRALPLDQRTDYPDDDDAQGDAIHAAA